MGSLREDLERLVRIPSVAFRGFDEAPVRACAQETLAVLREAGLEAAELVDVPGGPPAVWGATAAPAGAPTLLLYAHYDVQPAGDLDAWTSPPWEPVERDGRLYGRGTADDKSGIALHAALLRHFGGAPPIGLKVVIEGEEETGRGTFLDWVASDPARFACDAVVVADSGNWRVDEPTLTTSLRGLVAVDVDVATLKAPVHSGLFGGAVPDALVVLARIVASLHDEAGDVRVDGLAADGIWDGRAVDEAEMRASAGVLEGVGTIGSGSIADALLARPSITAIGLDAPAVDGAGNAIVPSARARLSCRLPPGVDPVAAGDAIVAHVLAVPAWGASVRAAVRDRAAGWRLEPGSPIADHALAALRDAYGKDAVQAGSGGAIPLVDVLARELDAPVVVWGASDDAARIHSADESVDLDELERAAAAQIALVERLAP